MTIMESRATSHYSATPLGSAYASGGNLPAPWIRLSIAFCNHTQAGQSDRYRSETLSGGVKSSVHGQQLRLLDAGTTHSAAPHLLNELLPKLLDDTIKRRVAVMPLSTAARLFIQKHRAYWSLMPEPVRAEFLIPSPQNWLRKPRTLPDGRDGC